MLFSQFSNVTRFMLEIILQIVSSCIIHCIVIQAGVNMAYSTVLVNGLQLDNIDNRNITESQVSWIGQ